MADPSGGGQEIVVWVFGVDTAFDGPAAQLDIFLGVAQMPAAGDADLLLNDV